MKTTSDSYNWPIRKTRQYTVTTSGVAGTEVAMSPPTLAVASITRSGRTVTVTTSTAHNLIAGMKVTIAGADQAAYNGRHIIKTAPTTTTFTYTLLNDEGPTTPATGTITVSYTVHAQWVLVRVDGANACAIGPNPDANWEDDLRDKREYKLPQGEGRIDMADWYVKCAGATSQAVKVMYW